ncbi:glycosyltransferase family 4 protein [Paenibacillus sonchi]|uniref:Glycosyltransferase family 4 protein n=1 Tax=Paenibacillus sonchi TaxID=373687 RepID=A0A974SFY2_9BACL|nr:glycosyltransferase family 4 protein [Paenibacillus sonchi]QQZ63776.1 glycosyltransferase family 4 protein [Paenibacillus sonchi]
MTTLNEDEQKSMVSHFPHLAERIRLLPNFVNSAIFYRRDKEQALAELGLDPENRYLITVGRLFEYQKGHSLLVQAAEQLRHIPDLKILIAGGGPDEQSLRTLIKEKNLEDRIILLGTIRNKDVLASYYSVSELFVLPSRYEGLPLVILEAGACGLPTVAFNVMGVRGLVQDGVSGLLAEGLQPSALAASLDTLLGNPELCAEMGEAALQIVRSDYSEEIIGARLYNLLQESLGLDPSATQIGGDSFAPELGTPV